MPITLGIRCPSEDEKNKLQAKINIASIIRKENNFVIVSEAIDFYLEQFPEAKELLETTSKGGKR